jgi:hypothetical protein
MNRIITACFAISSAFSCNKLPSPSTLHPDSIQDIFASESALAPQNVSLSEIYENADESLRVTVKWNPQDDSYAVSETVLELMGRDVLRHRSKTRDDWGSFRGSLRVTSNGREQILWSSLGIGTRYRSLNNELSFRFALPRDLPDNAIFTLEAEDADTGEMGIRYKAQISIRTSRRIPTITNQSGAPGDLVIRQIENSLAQTGGQKIRVLLYSDGFTINRGQIFWQVAQAAVQSLQGHNFPSIEKMEFYAALEYSNLKMPEPQLLGFPIPDIGTNLQLFFPYWQNFFGRWNNIV